MVYLKLMHARESMLQSGFAMFIQPSSGPKGAKVVKGYHCSKICQHSLAVESPETVSDSILLVAPSLFVRDAVCILRLQ